MKSPKYMQIKEYLKAETLKPEAASNLPSVRTLMRRFNVAKVTVNQALTELEHEKIIIRQQRRGIVAARELQYAEPVSAGKSPNAIFMAYPDFPSEQLWCIVFMMEQHARQCGFKIIPYKIYPNTNISMIIEAATRYPECRELLILPAVDRYSFVDLELLGSLPIPVVLLDCLFDYDDIPNNIYILAHDPILAGTLMAQYLLENGHRSIGFIRNEPQCDYGIRKQNAFVKTIRKGGGKIPASHIFSETIHSWDNTLTIAQQITKKNLDLIQRFEITALAYSSTLGAFGAIPILVDAGFSIPGEISLIGECDSSWYENANPPLTVLRPDYSHLCRRAVEIAEGKYLEKQTFFCPQEVVKRKSVGKV